MSWKVSGSYFESCSCDVVCPCTASLSLGATRDRCRIVLVFNVKDGEVDGHWGPKTKHSLKQYECRVGHEPDGKLTDAMVADLLKLEGEDIAKQCRE